MPFRTSCLKNPGKKENLKQLKQNNTDIIEYTEKEKAVSIREERDDTNVAEQLLLLSLREGQIQSKRPS